ncbi:hypothetical protein CVT24_005467 [Panaeolus cyanescens]|uniref:Phosphatidic acid phosphatase type 2/haloperoxidase domain-containing protein n=1 Tax=Panaeolus cyanescens TaxID=181874 RepID=A0A409YC55_9AGAR|nr:hypothetical protein CVT24_005467 [Panaeolus cyanescens]
MQSPPFPFKLAIPTLLTIGLVLPATNQILIPAIPAITWLLMWYSSRFMPSSWRPAISVSLLPTLESVLYGANISDILTRFTHPILDLIAWLPYGVFHFVVPFAGALIVWLFRSKPVLKMWARTFGYMNIMGVLIQLVLPCAPPWYELIHGLTPANYAMKGSPGGLMRIDRLFGGNGYTNGFTNSPLVFGAFPSLHAGNATLEALFFSHFFPHTTRYVWAYAGILYWSTMYLTHHYLIDVVGGACLAIASFYFFLPDELKSQAGATAPPANFSVAGVLRGRSKYELYDLEDPRNANGGGALGLGGVPGSAGGMLGAREFDVGSEPDSEDEELGDIAYRSPQPQAQSQSQAQSGSGETPKKSIPAHINTSVGKPRGHRHTASIASLIRGDERGPEDGWSPVAGSFGVTRGE